MVQSSFYRLLTIIYDLKNSFSVSARLSAKDS